LSAAVTPRRSCPALRLTEVVPPRGRCEHVTAVTSLGDEVFVVRWFGRRVEVYQGGGGDALQLLRYISVPGLDYSHGLTVSTHHRRLYVSDGFHDRLHAVELSGSHCLGIHIYM